MFGKLLHLASRAARFFYDATEPRGRRKAPQVTSLPEDFLLDASRRAKLTANSRDLHRNYSIMQWMIRCHLQYNTQFNFHARTDNEEFNTALEALLDTRSMPEQCDIRGRHSLGQFMRLAELRSLVDGDCGILRLQSLHLQAIESDRIKDPIGAAPTDSGPQWCQGILQDDVGRALKYGIWRRKRSGLEFEREINAANIYLLGYWDRFDQTRGITPISSALNNMRDVYDNIEQALLKCKVHNQFGLKIKRGQSGDDIQEETDETTGRSQYKVDFGAGPFLLDLDPNDDAEFLMSQHPPHEFQDFVQVVTMIALRALDLPYSFFDESHTNFFGSRGAWLHYERSCEHKRERIASLLNWITRWWIESAILSGELRLPKGMAPADIFWDWVPMGMPWWKPSEEINGDVMAIRAGLTTPQRVCRQRGTGDVFDNIREMQKVLKFAQELGVTLSYDTTPIIQVTNSDATQSNSVAKQAA